jgi:release factor glutamine methyltransferase
VAHDHAEPATLPPLPHPVLAALVGRLLGWYARLSGRHRYDDFRLETVQGARLIITPGVFNPKVLRTGEFFASTLDSSLIGPETDVLDMGTGSGVCAIAAARHGRKVVAVDINPAAVRCARINVLLNRLEDTVDVRQGDLFGPVAGERFDLILFNPPFVRGTPRDDRDRAWRSADVAERFAASLHQHLKPHGCALVLLSTYGDASMFLRQFHQHGLRSGLLAERRFVNERLGIFKLVVTP